MPSMMTLISSSITGTSMVVKLNLGWLTTELTPSVTSITQMSMSIGGFRSTLPTSRQGTMVEVMLIQRAIRGLSMLARSTMQLTESKERCLSKRSANINLPRKPECKSKNRGLILTKKSPRSYHLRNRLSRIATMLEIETRAGSRMIGRSPQLLKLLESLTPTRDI